MLPLSSHLCLFPQEGSAPNGPLTTQKGPALCCHHLCPFCPCSLCPKAQLPLPTESSGRGQRPSGSLQQPESGCCPTTVTEMQVQIFLLLGWFPLTSAFYFHVVEEAPVAPSQPPSPIAPLCSPSSAFHPIWPCILPFQEIVLKTSGCTAGRTQGLLANQ